MSPSVIVPSPLRRLRDGLSVAQIAIAVASVALAGGIAWLSLALAALGAAWAWRRPLPVEPSRAWQRGWTLLVFVALVATLLRAVLRAELLDAGVDFLLLLVVQRLFNRQHAREHAQLLLLGMLLLVVGSVINTEPSFLVLAIAYAVIAIMALIVNTLMAEGERLGARVMVRLEREAHARRRALWRAAIGVAMLAGIGAVLTFVLFPRWGAGVFLRGPAAGEVRSGFSSEVRLGGFGTIKTDATVIMRIRPRRHPGTRRTAWHLRGSAFDRYEDGRWLRSRDAPRSPLRAAYGFRAVADDGEARLRRRADPPQLVARSVEGFAGSDRLERATILLEDIGADLLFVPSDPIAVRVDNRGPVESHAHPVGGYNHEIRINKAPGPVQYEALWRARERPDRDELQAMGHPAVDPALRPFVQRSPGLSARVDALAERLVTDAHARTQLEEVEAILDHLQTLDYTLEQPRSALVAAGADPVEGFLFDTRAGHCEYFATAMAVLLRTRGIPTRIVNGYYGGHENAVGEFFAVRQADAHSWVEVHFGSLGWVTFDPTPASGRLAGDEAPWWPAASELLDALRNTYLEYVIAYDLGKQLSLLEGLGVRGRGSGSGSGQALRWVLLGLGLAGAGLWLLRRFGGRARTPIRPETRVLLRVLSRLAARGYPARPHEPPLALARRLRDEGVPGSDALAQVLIHYEALRFGPERDPATRERLRAQLTQDARAVLAALRRAPRRPSS